MSDDMILCEICGSAMHVITWKHLRSHSITLSEYKTRYPNHPIKSESAIARKKVGAALANAGRKGVARTTEVIEKIKQTKSVNQREAWNKGIPMTEEQKTRQSTVKKQQYANGELTHWNTGNSWSDEVKQKIRNAALLQCRSYSEESKQKRASTLELKKQNGWIPVQATPQFKQQVAQMCKDRYGIEYFSQIHMTEVIHLLQNYDWLCDQYVNLRKTACQIAQDLGINDTTVGRYLKKAEIEIRKHHHSYISVLWLEAIMESENIHIQHALNGGEYQIPGTRWKADGYCEATNTIYEFHGDYWHGNPSVYAPDDYNKSLYKTMGELYQNTIDREGKIKELGYNLVVIWEHEFLA